MKPIIALDADGVLVDYHEGYADAWARTFGERPALRDAAAYWPMDRWDVRHLEGEALAAFRQSFDAEFWEGLPPVAGAIQACNDLAAAGYELVCVTAMESSFESARLRNLRDHDFPISRVIATRSESASISPKAAALGALKPVAFVDDYLPYMQGIPEDIHTALVLREPNGSPNCGEALDRVNSHHVDLADFVRWWLAER
ncbi:MAG TPA: HAD family hydrolase [Azoarcus taiwanensis]|nr:HAD family hydrolase [Azoarcus taiwanensis]